MVHAPMVTGSFTGRFDKKAGNNFSFASHLNKYVGDTAVKLENRVITSGESQKR